MVVYYGSLEQLIRLRLPPPRLREFASTGPISLIVDGFPRQNCAITSSCTKSLTGFRRWTYEPGPVSWRWSGGRWQPWRVQLQKLSPPILWSSSESRQSCPRESVQPAPDKSWHKLSPRNHQSYTGACSWGLQYRSTDYSGRNDSALVTLTSRHSRRPFGGSCLRDRLDKRSSRRFWQRLRTR